MQQPSPKPWRNWYHCMGNTFGTWLPGDPRGFRTPHHRDHVEGDYRFPPPPGIYDELYQRSQHLMKRSAVFLPDVLRPLVCRLLADTLREQYQVQVVELSVGGVHFHLLARFVPVGVDPYEQLDRLRIRLTHAKSPRPGGRGLSAYDHDPVPRRILGLARSWVTHQLKQQGHFAEHTGGIWARRPKMEPIRGREHQLAAVGYIRRHGAQRSAVLSNLPP
jgi:hypothetical protein